MAQIKRSRYFKSHSAKETVSIGRKLGQLLPPNQIVSFLGDLGSGKTTLIKGLVETATGVNRQEVQSPTFVYLNIYKGPKTIYHFDLYRLKGKEDFLKMGFDEFLFAGGISLVEWGERISSLLPPEAMTIEIHSTKENERKIKIRNFNFEGEL